VSNQIAQDVMNKWLDSNKAKLKELAKEFLVQGFNSKGIYSISVVSEDVKNKLEQKWKDFKSWLYSIETKSNSKSLNNPDPSSIQVYVLVFFITRIRFHIVISSRSM
jgi:hypothetical protein